MSFFHFGKNRSAFFLLSVFFALCLAGCGKEQPAETPRVKVKAMQPVSYQMPLSAEFVAQLQGTEEVAIQAKVSGIIVEKYVHGGDMVQVGQPMFKIDSRQYESKVDSAHADFVEAQVDLHDARVDLERDRELVKAGVISEQEFTSQEAKVAAYQAVADAKEAASRKAREDLDDTTVYAPLTGQLALDDVSIGTYAQAGATNLVSLGAPDPIYAQFSISETEYLKYIASAFGGDLKEEVSITLEGGQKYPLMGKLVTSDRALDESTKNLVVKALFPNPDALLMPGMIARIKLMAGHDAKVLLVPQHAVQQILDKYHVIVAGEGNKSEIRVVELGQKIGDYYVIRQGVQPEDVIVVDGLTNLQGGKEMEVTMVTPEEMHYSMAAKDSGAQ